MSWSSAIRPIVAAGILLGAATALGACSFTPVYSGATASQGTLELAYAKPATRLEQIVYQELALRLGSSESATAPLAMATVSAATSAIGRDSWEGALSGFTYSSAWDRRDGIGR